MEFLQKGVCEPPHSCLLCFYAILGKEVKTSSKTVLYTKVEKTQNIREEHALKPETGVCIYDNFAPYHIRVTMQGIFPLLPSEKRILLVGSSSKPSLIRTLQIRLEKQMMGKCACSILCWIFSTVKQNNWWPQHTLAHRWCIYDGQMIDR